MWSLTNGTVFPSVPTQQQQRKSQRNRQSKRRINSSNIRSNKWKVNLLDKFFQSEKQKYYYTVERLKKLHLELVCSICVVNSSSLRGDKNNRDNYDDKIERIGWKTFMSSSILGFVGSRKNTDNFDDEKQQKVIKREDIHNLNAAFRILSATPSPDKEFGFDDGAIAHRDDTFVFYINKARSLEVTIIELIRCIGEVVIYSEQEQQRSQRYHLLQQQQNNRNNHRRSSNPTTGTTRRYFDPVFEYFCDKHILSLLVDIVKEKPTIRRSKSDCHGNNEDYNGSTNQMHHSQCYYTKPSKFSSGVVWAPQVKVQALQTISMLITNITERTSLYFILSNHCMNDLITSILPMKQWTGPALEEIVPVYVTLLKSLGLKLLTSPNDLFPFFLNNRCSYNNNNNGTNTNDEDGNRDKSSSSNSKLPSQPFPLLTAAIEVATSNIAQSDSFIYVTCLNLVVNILRNARIQSWLTSSPYSIQEQRVLVEHLLCKRLVDRYKRMVQITKGCVVDPIRSDAMKGQLMNLHDQIQLINDIFFCNIKALNVRMCEYLLRHVVLVALKNLIGHSSSSSSNVGINNDDIISEKDALQQVSLFFLVQLFVRIEHSPFTRMLSVCCFHPLSPKEIVRKTTGYPTNNNANANNKESEDAEYIIMPALNKVVQEYLKNEINYNNSDACCDNGEGDQVLDSINNGRIDNGTNTEEDDNDADIAANNGKNEKHSKNERTTDIAKVVADTGAVANPYRKEILHLLGGDKGEWHFIPAAILLESMFKSRAIDLETLTSLNIIPTFTKNSDDDDGQYPTSPWEQALETFFSRQCKTPSIVSTMALECAGSVSLEMISCIVDCYRKSAAKARQHSVERGGNNSRLVQSLSIQSLFSKSPVIRGLGFARSNFASNSKEIGQEAKGGLAHFLDLVQLSISSRFTAVKKKEMTTTATNALNSTASIVGQTIKEEMHYVCSLSTFASSKHVDNPNLLVRKLNDVNSNDVEYARFCLYLTLHFRGICNSVKKFYEETVMSIDDENDCPELHSTDIGLSKEDLRNNKDHHIQFDHMDFADELLLSIGELKKNTLEQGTDIGLRGRTVFRLLFPVPNQFDDRNMTNKSHPDGIVVNAIPKKCTVVRKRKFSSENVEKPQRHTSQQLLLVLDPTDLYIVKPTSSPSSSSSVVESERRGIVLFSVRLSSIIAFAPDGQWLHVAIRHIEDIPNLSKNGNVALCFDSVGTSLVVRQYLERSRDVLRNDLMKQTSKLFKLCSKKKFLGGDDDSDNINDNKTNDISSSTNDASASLTIQEMRIEEKIVKRTEQFLV